MSGSSNISKRRKSALSYGSAEYTAKRNELIRIAAKLFREQGYQATRLADIASAAGIDRASLYYYIGRKEELLREAIGGILDVNLKGAQEINAQAKEPVASRLRQIVTMLMTSYAENFPYMYVYIQEQMHQVAKEESAWAQEMLRKTRRFEQIVRDLIDEGIRNEEFRDDIPVRLASSALFGMFNWTHRWYTPGGALSAEEVADAFFQIFFGGMRRASRRRKASSPTKPRKSRVAPANKS